MYFDNKKVGLKTGMTDEDKAQRMVAEKAIDETLDQLEAAGFSPLERQAFSQASRRELAKQKPDGSKYELASEAVRRYKQHNTGQTNIY